MQRAARKGGKDRKKAGEQGCEQLEEGHEPAKQTSVLKLNGAKRVVDYREYKKTKECLPTVWYR